MLAEWLSERGGRDGYGFGEFVLGDLTISVHGYLSIVVTKADDDTLKTVIGDDAKDAFEKVVKVLESEW